MAPLYIVPKPASQNPNSFLPISMPTGFIRAEGTMRNSSDSRSFPVIAPMPIELYILTRLRLSQLKRAWGSTCRKNPLSVSLYLPVTASYDLHHVTLAAMSMLSVNHFL